MDSLTIKISLLPEGWKLEQYGMDEPMVKVEVGIITMFLTPAQASAVGQALIEYAKQLEGEANE